MEIYDLEQLDVYKKVLKHRNHCLKYRSGFVCLDCFGGGLQKFTEDLLKKFRILYKK